jgi:2',3'-cyclic-nucleotide 2'-phosphodiesterase (5'-nucleotidase family)
LLAATTLLGQPALKPLTILHSNDIHARLLPMADGRGGMAQLATVIQREKANCPQCIVLSCGDLVQGTPVSTMFRGAPIFEIANGLGFDVATLGNHDFDYGWKTTLDFIKIAKYPMVSANVVNGDGSLFTKPYVILKAAGLRVAVIGAMTPSLKRLQLPVSLGSVRALPLTESLRPYLPELKQKSDVIVLLAHLTPEDEDEVLRTIPEIQVIIGGHIHFGLKEMKGTATQWLFRVQGNGVELGRMDLQVDPVKKTVVSAKASRIPVDSSVAPAQNVAQEVAKWEDQVTKLMDVPIGEAKRAFSKADLKILIEQALREQTGADLAFMGRGGIRDVLSPGVILVRHVWNIFPFDNLVVSGKFRGAELPSSVTAGTTIDPRKQYVLATNEFAAANQSSPSELNSSGLAFPTIGPLQRDVLINWIKKKKILE